MTVVKGSDVFIALEATKIVNATTGQGFDWSANMINTTTKDTGGTQTFVVGEDQSTHSIEGKLDPAGTYSWYDLLTAAQAKAALACLSGEGLKTIGESQLSFSALLSGLTRTDPEDDNSTWSATLQITGAITVATSVATIPG